jgi:riboflavin kinase
LGNKKVEDLLLWRDVKVSAAVFTAITVAYLILEWSHLSLLRIVAHSLLAGVTVAFLWNNVASFTNRPAVPIPAVIQNGVTESQVRSFAEKATGPINKLFAFTKRVISGQDVFLSLQVAAALYVFGRLGNYFTSLGLVYIVVVLAFTLPKVYELKKDEIDAVVRKLYGQSKTYYKQYAEPYVQKIPRASTSTSTHSTSTPATKQNPVDSVADSFTHIAKDGSNAVEGKKAI